jgi:hypothetical protein
VTLGTEYRGIPVLPLAEDGGGGGAEGSDRRTDRQAAEEQNASERLAEAKATGAAAAVHVNTKQLW